MVSENTETLCVKARQAVAQGEYEQARQLYLQALGLRLRKRAMCQPHRYFAAFPPLARIGNRRAREGRVGPLLAGSTTPARAARRYRQHGARGRRDL